MMGGKAERIIAVAKHGGATSGLVRGHHTDADGAVVLVFGHPDHADEARRSLVGLGWQVEPLPPDGAGYSRLRVRGTEVAGLGCFPWPCGRRYAHGPHPVPTLDPGAEGWDMARVYERRCPGVKAHPLTMIGGRHRWGQ